MRILISIPRFEPGKTLGSEIYLNSFLESFSKAITREKVGVVASETTCAWGEKLAKNFEWLPQRLSESTIRRTIFENGNIEKTARNWNAGVVYFPFNIMPRIKTPSVLLLHDLVNEFYCKRFPFYRPVYYRCVKRLVRNSVKNAGTVITISNAVADELRELKLIADGKKIHVIPLAVSRKVVERKKPKLLPEDNKIIILQSGAQLPHKSHITGVKAMVELNKMNPNVFKKVRLVLTGGANKDKNLKSLIKENKIDDNICFLGRLDAEELEWVMTHAAIACFPTLYEGFGLGVVDAQLRGTSVIASNIAVLNEVSAGAAKFFEPENEIELSEKIVEMLKCDSENSVKLEDEPLRNFSSWNWRNHSEKVLEILTSASKK